jgi:hypothetical protein
VTSSNPLIPVNDFSSGPEFGSGFRRGKGRNLEFSTFRVLVVAKETFVFLTLAPSISWRFYRGESGILTPKIFSAAAEFEKCGFRDGNLFPLYSKYCIDASPDPVAL